MSPGAGLPLDPTMLSNWWTAVHGEHGLYNQIVVENLRHDFTSTTPAS